MAVFRSTVANLAAPRLAASSPSSSVLSAVPRTASFHSAVFSAIPRTAPNFTIKRESPLMIAPDRPTPRQSLYLSNIDDQRGLRYNIPNLLFYRGDSSKRKNKEDPVKVIREALAKVLVHYYPFAGRLRDSDNGKLSVDCTGEGVPFVEADADISLEEFGDVYPPIPRGNEFIENVPGSENITDSPLLLVQVTRLRCGGFILGLRVNHCMSDGVGVAQFIKALSEMARGAASPAVPPVWNREILRHREKPTVKFPHHEYDERTQDEYKELVTPPDEMDIKSFFFGPRDIEALKEQVEGSECTTFEAISACLWKSRTKALNLPTDQKLRLLFPLNARSRFGPRLPTGYYGNAISLACAEVKAGDLTHRPLSFAVKLINEAKRRIDEEYVRSVIDLMEVKGRPHFPLGASFGGSFLITDLRRLGYAKADFGWGKAVYGGLTSGVGPGRSNLSVPLLKDFHGVVAPMCLPSVAMESFEEIVNPA